MKVESEEAKILKALSPEQLGERFLQKARSGFICPNPDCRDGSGRDGTGVTVYPDEGDGFHYYCGKCARRYDNIDILGFYYNLNPQTQFREILSRAAEDFNLSGFAPVRESTQKPFVPDKHKAKINAAHQNLANFVNSMPDKTYRGLTLATLNSFHCGFLSNWFAREDAPITPRFIIPTSFNHYLARYTGEEQLPPNLNSKEHRGPKEIFNFKRALKNSDNPLCIIVEGEFDAMSIWQATNGKVNVVAISGCALSNSMERQIKSLNCTKNFVVMLDNDDAGHKAAPVLVNKLKFLGHRAIQTFLDFDGDFNALLQKDPANLKNQIRAVVDNASEIFARGDDQISTEGQDAPDAFDTADSEKNSQPKNIFDVQLSDALVFLNSLASETITAEIATAHETIRNIAIAQLSGFADEANKFFDILKTAKTNAKNKLREADDELITLPDDERKHFNSLLSVDIASLRQNVKREVSTVAKQRKTFLAEQKRLQDEQRLAQMQVTEEKTRDELIADIISLRQLPRTDERDATIRKMIRDLCEWKLDKQKRRIAIKPTAANLNLIFTYDPDLDGLFGYDEFQNAVVKKKPAPWDFNFQFGMEWKRTDDSELRHFIRTHYAECSSEKNVADALTHFSNANHFHEVKAFFESLPQWDNIPRAETLFVTFLGAKDTRFNRVVTMNWLIAAFARVFYPGCNYQQCIVLQGAQGTGKSRLFEMLAGGLGVNPTGRKWNASIQDQLGSPQVIDQIQKSWINELEEGVATSKADVRAIKAFLSTSSDLRRFPYDPQARYAPRHGVYALTTNEVTILRDNTGNRRFQIIKCRDIPNYHPIPMTKEYIRLVLAEAYFKFKEMFKDGFDEEKLQLPNDIIVESEANNAKYTQDDGLQTEFTSWIERKLPPKPIWLLLSRKERADFCANGFVAIPDGKHELIHRRRHGSQKNREDDISTLRELFYDKNVVEERSVLFGSNSIPSLVIYGTEPRKHVCIAEVVNECFAGKRIPISRVSEILFSLETNGWSRGTKIFKGDNVYSNQRNYLVRDDNPTSDENNPDNHGQNPPTENPPQQPTQPTQPTNQPSNTQPQPPNPPNDPLQGEPVDLNTVAHPFADPPPYDPNNPDRLPF